MSPRPLLLALLCAALPLACASETPPPAEGETAAPPEKKKTILLSTEYDDLSAGQEAARQIEAEMGLYDSEVLADYVSEIGARLVQHAPLRPFQYRFHVVDQMAPNAFSLPGGHIYVSRGLLALAQNDDELACVLGHEIIHAAERHAAAQQELARRTNPLTMPYIRLAKLAAYSRDHERAADRGGQNLAARAGYDPGGMTEFLKHLGNSERLTIGYSRLTSYFDTHPGTTERVATTAAHADTLEWSRDPLRPGGRAVYLRKIEGVILDTNPAEGIFREAEFIHPDLDFRILFPRDWVLVNTHQAVGAVSPEGSARIFIELEAPKRTAPEPSETTPDAATEPASPPEMPTPKEAAARLVANHEDEFAIRVLREQPIQLGEIETYRLDIEGRLGTASVLGQISFIPHNGFLFRLTSVARSGAWDRYQGRVQTSARTFRPLTPEERDSVEVLRLAVVHAQEGEDIPSLSLRARNAWPAGRTAVLNGVFVDTRFAEGDLVKIASAQHYRGSRPEAPETGDTGLRGPEPSVETPPPAP